VPQQCEVDRPRSDGARIDRQLRERAPAAGLRNVDDGRLAPKVLDVARRVRPGRDFEETDELFTDSAATTAQVSMDADAPSPRSSSLTLGWEIPDSIASSRCRMPAANRASRSATPSRCATAPARRRPATA
jgi:hypothetical protein